MRSSPSACASGDLWRYVEDFSLDRLRRLKDEEIEERFQVFKEMLQF